MDNTPSEYNKDVLRDKKCMDGQGDIRNILLTTMDTVYM